MNKHRLNIRTERYNNPPINPFEKDDRWKKSIAFILKWEGSSYVVDSGGPTKYGISMKAFPQMTETDIKNLTEEKAKQIYFDEYWLKSRAASRPMPLCAVLLDSAVNHGVKKALKLFRTFNTENFFNTSADIIVEREKIYKNLAKHLRYQKYLKGWLNRLADLRRLICRT